MSLDKLINSEIWENKKIDWNNPNINIDEILWIPDIDEIEGFYTENENHNRWLEKINNDYENFDIIESKYNIKIIVNEEEKSLIIKNRDDKIIWEIKISKYKDRNFKKEIHLYNVFED